MDTGPVVWNDTLGEGMGAEETRGKLVNAVIKVQMNEDQALLGKMPLSEKGRVSNMMLGRLMGLLIVLLHLLRDSENHTGNILLKNEG